MCILNLLGVVFFKCQLRCWCCCGNYHVILAVIVSNTFSCFWYPGQFWGVLIRYSLACPSTTGIYLMFFSWWAGGGLCFLEEDNTKCHFHPIISRVHSINMIYDYWCSLYHLADGVFVRFLHYKITLSSSHYESHCVYPMLKKLRVMLPFLWGGIST